MKSKEVGRSILKEEQGATQRCVMIPNFPMRVTYQQEMKMKAELDNSIVLPKMTFGLARPFRMVGFGENIGSGFPEIIAAWKETGWGEPELKNKV